MARPAVRRVSPAVPVLAAACDSLREALIIVDDRRVIRYMNAVARDMIGATGDLMARPPTCSALLGCGSEDHPAEFCGHCWGSRALEDGVATPFFETAVGPAGARVRVEGSCSPVPGAEGFAVLFLRTHPRPGPPLAPEPGEHGLSAHGRAVSAALVRTVRTLLDADYAALGRVDASASEVVWLAQDGSLSEETANLRVRIGQGVRGRVISTGRALVISHFPEGSPDPPDQHPTMRSEHLRAALAVPVLIGGEPVGVLMAGSRREAAYGQAEERVLDILADLGGALFADTDGVLTAQAESIRAEREWLAAELHDGLAQSLAALTQKLKLVRFLLGRSSDSVSLNAVLQEVLELSEHTHRDLRQALGDLHAPVADGDFLPALQAYLDSFAQRSHLRVELVEVPEHRPPLPAAVALQVLRVIQEALTNAHKHSDGTRVLVGWSAGKQGQTFTVSDNGRGFTRQQAGHGFGLTIMAERARRIGASFTVTTGPETGCTVVLSVPDPAGGGVTLEPDTSAPG